MSSLAKLKVLDLTTHLSGPYCSMILADHGADVVKVENPKGGDPLRHSPPFKRVRVLLSCSGIEIKGQLHWI